MKKVTRIFYYNIALLLLALLIVGCSDDTGEGSKLEVSEDVPVSQSEERKTNDREEDSQINKGADESKSTTESEENVSNGNSSEETANKDSNITPESKEDNPLSEYSSEEIEYARVWRQLGPNQDLEHLIVSHIPAGTPLDPEHDSGVSYPENVVQLTGTRIVDGIVTYSGNGDGTINVYNIPRRWYGGFAPPSDLDEDTIRKQMEDIINNPKLVYVEPDENEDIIKLINLISIED